MQYIDHLMPCRAKVATAVLDAIDMMANDRWKPIGDGWYECVEEFAYKEGSDVVLIHAGMTGELAEVAAIERKPKFKLNPYAPTPNEIRALRGRRPLPNG